MENEFSLKELYDVFLKTTYPMEIAGKQFQEGETLCIFDKIQISNFNENKEFITAHGGFQDRDRVFWTTTKDLSLTFSQGIFNALQFALLCNANMIYTQNNTAIKIPTREKLESDQNKVVTLSKTPCSSPFFYNAETGAKLSLTQTGEKTYLAPSAYLEVLVDYYYDYENGAQIVTIGQSLINGFLRLEGKTRVKDDITGNTRTGIIEIPATPVVANFNTLAIPIGTGGQNTTINLFFLNNDIDSDM